MNLKDLYFIVETLDKTGVDLYAVADEFHDEASDQIDVDVLHTANVVCEIVEFLKTKLPDGFPRPAPPRKPNVTPFRKM